MTAQFREGVIYKGIKTSMCSEPLEIYLANMTNKLHFKFDCSACWRGYIGQWEIDSNKLYLNEINGTLTDGSLATIKTLFPDSVGRVFASWFSGKLRITKGRQIKYIHMGYESIYEVDLYLEFNKGHLIDTTTQENFLD